MRGSSVKGWVNHLLGFFQLGLGQVFSGLLEGLLNGPEGIPVRKRVRAVLKILNGSKGIGVGPSLLPISTGRVKGLPKMQLGLKGFGLWFPLKSKRATRLKSSRRDTPPAVESSSLVGGLESHPLPASEVRLGASDAEPHVPMRVLGENYETVVDGFSPGAASLRQDWPPAPKSPLHAVGSEFYSLPATEGRLGASEVMPPAVDGSSPGAALLTDPEPVCSSVLLEAFTLPFAVDLPSSPLCRDREDYFSPKADVGPGSSLVVQQTPPMSSHASSVVAYPLGRDREGSVPAVTDPVFSPALKEAQAKTVRNSAPAMGLLRRGFFGPRTVSPSLSLSSQGCKVAPVKATGNSAPEKGLIRRGFFGSSSASPINPVVSQVCSTLSAAPISDVSKSQLAYSRRVKENC